MAAILVMCLWVGTRKAQIRRTEQAWLPEELRHARIEFAERHFYAKRPVRLIAKVDRVYKDERGTLFVTELKRRVKTQAYLSDVVELSAQKLAIERGGRRAVAEIGFVVIEHPVTQKRTPIRVRLLREHEIVPLAQRYVRLVDGGAIPDKANVAGLCRSCAYADRCRPEVLINSSAPRRTRHAW
jgi:CRISPR/Cas system-associated exonuclease Cas4 (RecB family)